jgi:hypothetical protein
MNQTAILWPMLSHVLLVYIIYGIVSLRRIQAVKAGSARTSQFRENREEPAESVFAHNNLLNQFQLPVLFHTACLSFYATGGVDVVPLLLAWLFAASRYIHAWIHVTTNRIRHRRPVFILGYFVLGVMWLWFALHLVAGV